MTSAICWDTQRVGNPTFDTTILCPFSVSNNNRRKCTCRVCNASVLGVRFHRGDGSDVFVRKELCTDCTAL
jgi:hypothetical protein